MRLTTARIGVAQRYDWGWERRVDFIDDVGTTYQEIILTKAAPNAPYISADGTMTVVWVSGGTAGERYTLTNTIVTAGATPRTHQRSIIIPCADR